MLKSIVELRRSTSQIREGTPTPLLKWVQPVRAAGRSGPEPALFPTDPVALSELQRTPSASPSMSVFVAAGLHGTARDTLLEFPLPM